MAKTTGQASPVPQPVAVLVRFLDVIVEVLVADLDALGGELVVRQAVTAAAGVFEGLEANRPEQVADSLARLTHLRGQVDKPPRPPVGGDELLLAAVELLAAEEAHRLAATPDNRSRLARARHAVDAALHSGEGR